MSEAFRIGIAGLGTVGVGVIKELQENAELIGMRAGRPVQIVAVSARSRKDRGVDLSGYNWTENPASLADAKVDAVVELMGGANGDAHELVQKTLAGGKHVVTANKAMIAEHGVTLAQLAEKNGVCLEFEAAVAGAIPIIRTLREGLAGNQIQKVFGIINGTCNYILTEMTEKGLDFANVLQEAQRLGYAEADPAFDVEGIDASHKLAILSAIAFGVKPDLKNMEVEGITGVTAADIKYAREQRYRIKLLGRAENDGGRIRQTVGPCLVKENQPLAGVNDAFNAVQVIGNYSGAIFTQGRGAGQNSTASAVVGDIVHLARGTRIPSFGIPAAKLKDLQPADKDRAESEFYVRLNGRNVSGTVAKISAIMGDHNISINSMNQPPAGESDFTDIVLLTHKCRQAQIDAALEKIGTLRRNVQGGPSVMPIVEL